MRPFMLPLGLAVLVALGVVFFGDWPYTRSEPPPSVTTSSKLSCDEAGSEINAMLDSSSKSPAIAPATTEFERGVAECMWGRVAAANEHYRQAYRLLRGQAAGGRPPDSETVSGFTARPQRDLTGMRSHFA